MNIYTHPVLVSIVYYNLQMFTSLHHSAYAQKHSSCW